MKDGCAEITNVKDVELRSGLVEPGKHHTDCGFMIPAGILIGIGVGILVDLIFTGFLIGLGLGFLGEGLFPLIRKSQEAECTRKSVNMNMLLIGAFLVLLGISFVVAPAAIWPYAFAGIFILGGIWVLFRGLRKTT